MIFLNAARFMEEAIASVHAQTFEDWELILVDDGAFDGSSNIALEQARKYPGRIRRVEHPQHANRGMSASRQRGVEESRGRWIAFLDADDVWHANKLREQLSILDAHPRAGMLYGAPLYWHGWTGVADDIHRNHVPGIGFSADRLFEAPELLRLTAPLGTGHVPCPSDVIVSRTAVDRVGGFEPTFRGAYEDVAFYVKVYLQEPVFVASATWTNYRIHSESCISTAVRTGSYQSSRLFFFNWFEQFLHRKGLAGTDIAARLQSRLIPYRHALLPSPTMTEERPLVVAPNPVPVDVGETLISWKSRDGASARVCVSEDGGEETLIGNGATGSVTLEPIKQGVMYEVRLYPDVPGASPVDRIRVTRLVDPGVGGESFGSLRRVVPVSRVFGFDRGQPVDRYYIDQFLAKHADDIRGRVLEIGESTYTKRFGGSRVESVDVLHIKPGNPDATIVGDLAAGGNIPSDAYDCILLVQTLQLIFDTKAVIRTLHRILKSDGVVLATFPGISHKGRDEWTDAWCWAFTSVSASRLFGEQFAPAEVSIEKYGNVLATTAFLYGMASSELSVEELDYSDDCYEMLLAVRARKSAARRPVRSHPRWRLDMDAALHHVRALGRKGIYGVVEHPNDNAQIAGALHISGWAFSRRGAIESVEAFFGDTSLGQLTYGCRRPDVAAVFPAVSTSAGSGYAALIPCSPLMPGTGRLTVRVRDEKGRVEDFHREIEWRAG
jgi:glycosyltransferase involved in cell wall biosynthesis